MTDETTREQNDERRLIRRTVASYLKAHAPERLADLELLFDPVYDAMAEPVDDAAGADDGGGERGLPIDASFLDGAVVSSAVWAAASLLHVWRRGRDEDTRRQVEESVARELANPELVRRVAAGLRRELAGAEGEPAVSSPASHDGEAAGGPEPRQRNELSVRWQPGATVLNLRLTAPGLDLDQCAYDPKPLKHSLYDTCTRLISDVETAEDEHDVASRGAMLFADLLPEPLREHLWALHDRGERTLRIVSDEPWIPWEAVRLHGRRGDPHAAGPFLADAFDLVRWLPGRRAAGELPWRRVAVVAPRNAGLPRAESEVADVLAMQQDGRSVERVEARKDEVRRALASGSYDGWHFCGHGGHAGDHNAEESRLDLEEGRSLKAVDLHSEAARLGTARPLVFVNACHAARGGLTLTGIGGWAAAFLACGAGAFLGPTWSIRDRRAQRFAGEFYRRFVAGEPIAGAVRGARDLLAPDVARLAYALYADPEALCAAPAASDG